MKQSQDRGKWHIHGALCYALYCGDEQCISASFLSKTQHSSSSRSKVDEVVII
jgi:hypothetical protein